MTDTLIITANSKERLINVFGIKENDQILVIIRSVAKSGMSRRMSFFYVTKQGNLHNITFDIANLLDMRVKDFAINVSGCGMDMAYHMVSRVSTELFGDYKLLKSCIL